MELNQRNLKKVQLVVVGAVTLMFILVTVVTFQIALRISHNRMENDLRTARDRLENQMYIYENDLAHFETWRFIEEFALRHLGWGRPGESIWRG